jgi:folate-binding protein YgfZ
MAMIAPESGPFEPFYQRLGAPADRDASGVPPFVKGFPEEYRAAISSALVLDRSNRGGVRVAGKDRESFLQNMLTNDVRSLPPGGGVTAAFLTSKGKLVSDLWVLKEESSFLLELERSRVEPFTKALGRYIISEDVVLESLVGREVSFSIVGPGASSILAALAETSSARLDGMPHLYHARIEIGGLTARLTAYRRERSARFEVGSASERAAELLSTVLDKGALLGGTLVSELRRIESGIPRFGVDMDESHFPQEASLDDAISFQKGCYIGQEYVVRLAHRGHLNRKLVGLVVPSGPRPSPGSRILRGEDEVGMVTSSTNSPALPGSLALAYLKREAFEPGTPVIVEGGAEATVSALPFTIGERRHVL